MWGICPTSALRPICGGDGRTRAQVAPRSDYSPQPRNAKRSTGSRAPITVSTSDVVLEKPDANFETLLTKLGKEHDRLLSESQLENARLREDNLRMEAELARKVGPGGVGIGIEAWTSPSSSGRRGGRVPLEALRDDNAKADGEEAPVFLLKSAWRSKSVSDGWRSNLDPTMVCDMAGSLLKKEVLADEEKEPKPFCIISPTSNLRFMWDIFGLLLIVFDMVNIPLGVFAIPKSTFSETMDWVTLVFWTLDMIQSFFLGYYLRGDIVTDHKKIIQRYCRTWLIVDLLVVVPDWIVTLLQTSGGEIVGLGRMLRATRAVRVLRLLRLLKLKRIANTVYDMIDSEYTFIMLDLVRLMTVILALNHVIACTWFWIGTTGHEQNQPNWLENAGHTPVLNSGVGWQYTTSLHWSLTQFTPASMDVSARNLQERIFSIAVLFFSLVAFGTIVGSVTASMTQLRKLKEDRVKQFWMLRRYLKQQHVANCLKERIVKFLEHREEQKHMMVETKNVSILLGLSHSLKSELNDELHSPTLELHPMMQYMSDCMRFATRRLCSEALKVNSYGAQDVIFYAGDGAVSMFFVKTGSFNYELNEHTAAAEHVLQEPMPLNTKAWVSEAVLWTEWQHRGKFSAYQPGELLTLDPAAFAKVMCIHPRPWTFARNYATHFLDYVNSIKSSALTDLLNIEDFYGEHGRYSEEIVQCDKLFQDSAMRLGLDVSPQVSPQGPDKGDKTAGGARNE